MVELKVNKDDLEKALTSAGKKNEKPAANSGEVGKISPEEEIGFHKGALNTLVNERNELVKMIQTIEAIMQAHLKRLEELGVKVK